MYFSTLVVYAFKRKIALTSEWVQIINGPICTHLGPEQQNTLNHS